ncbi:MAG: glycosyltransferase family 2 protein [Bacteroidales bacterium]|nr:glycosyltransferase family 2 protein [Bacteroidales bacterium]
MDITVAIPVYNADIYIVSALRSVLEQDFGGDYEIIVVDDHGTDHSMDEVRALQRAHSRGHLIRVIRPERNVGQAKGREMALQAAQGRCFYMMDADDLILPHTLSFLYNLQETHNADFVAASCAWGEDAAQRMVFDNVTLKDNRSIQYYNARYASWCCIWNILYKTDFLKQCGFVIDDRNMTGVDDIYLRLQVMEKARYAVFCSEITYLYRWNTSSESTQLMYKRRWEELLEDGIRFHEVYMRPTAWPKETDGKGVVCQGLKVKRAAWHAMALCGRLLCAKDGVLDAGARRYLRRLLVFPIPGNWVQTIGRIIRLDDYRLKVLAVYGLYCLPTGLKTRYAYRYGRKMYGAIASSDGNRADWESRMTAFYMQGRTSR